MSLLLSMRCRSSHRSITGLIRAALSHSVAFGVAADLTRTAEDRVPSPGPAGRAGRPTTFAGHPQPWYGWDVVQYHAARAHLRAFTNPILPRILAPALISTPSPILGWRSRLVFPVPPSVTDCRMDTLLPTTAVSPMTRPVAWSSMMPWPIFARGGMNVDAEFGTEMRFWKNRRQ